MTVPDSPLDDTALYERGVATLLAAWEAIARGSPEAEVHHFSGVAAAVFPREPERSIYNNALLDRRLGPAERAAALDAMEAAYASAGVERFAAWAHESDGQMRAALEARGYTLAETTRAMGMCLSDLRLPRPHLDLAPADWTEYVRHLATVGVPDGLLAGVDPQAFHLLLARLDGETVATALGFELGGDCGVYNVSTLERARRRGIGTALTALLLHDAVARGCRTASLQATEMAEGIYAAIGFRDLGRILEYVPGARQVGGPAESLRYRGTRVSSPAQFARSARGSSAGSPPRRGTRRSCGGRCGNDRRRD
jgi:GNAT superfamily N-acetyltransferase